MSVGDVDGDGQYEYVVKWDPSNSKDVSQVGYTGNVYIDAYELDGTLLYRIDLGVNIRAGAHYTQFLVYDFDGDGRAEMMFKTAPGTKIIRYARTAPWPRERYITMPRQDVRAGYSHTDDYRLSAADYREHLVELFLGWHEHPEVVAGHWPATLEQAFGIAPPYAYPLSRADAEALRRLLHRRVRAQPQHPQHAARVRGLHRGRPGVPDRLRRAPPAGSCRPSATSRAGTTTA